MASATSMTNAHDGPRSTAPSLAYKREKRLTLQSFSTYSSDSENEEEDEYNKNAVNAQNGEANGRIWTAKKILLVATCTSSMILNVSYTPFHPLSYISLMESLKISCQNSASVALPKIGRDFNVTEAELQWIVSGYSLSSVSVWITGNRSFLLMRPRDVCSSLWGGSPICMAANWRFCSESRGF